MKTLAAALAALACTSAWADGGALVKTKNCIACHAVDRAMVGPSYKDVAVRYKADKGAEAKLAERIVKGGTGTWGKNVMPPSPQVNADEAKQMAAWILALK